MGGGGGGMPMMGNMMGSISASVTGSVGIAQMLAGASMKVRRPKYHIPGAAQDAMSTAKQMANQSVRPGNEQAIKDIDRATTGSVQNARRTSNSASQILGASGIANSQRLRALGQNNALNAQFQFNAKNNLINQLNNYAGYQEKEFDVNVMQPYELRAQTKAALIGAGMQNFMKSQDDFANAWGAGGGAGQAPGANNVMAAPKPMQFNTNAGGPGTGGFNPNFQAQYPQAGSGYYPQGMNKNAFSYLYANQ